MELRVTALIPLTATLIVAPLLGAPIAQGDPAPNWSGNYKVTFHTDQKSGSSMAATQSEEPYSATYQFSTDCSSGGGHGAPSGGAVRAARVSGVAVAR